MKFIAHRGNITDQYPNLENTPQYIEEAIKKGFDVEIDVWKNNYLYLGHDYPQYRIDIEFLKKHQDKLWCHAKNIEALEFLLKYNFHAFWHQNDSYTLTSKKYIWAFPKFMANGILVMPENKFDTKFILENKHNIKGICSDKIKYYREFLE
jgi:glycerophosphoryl diester phosphodiesterase